MTPDVRVYEQIGHAIYGEDYFPQIYKERLLQPFLMASLTQLGFDRTAVLWITVLTGFLAIWSIAYLAHLLSRGRLSVILTACVLYIIYPNTYKYGATLGPDLLHAHLALFAIACTAGWAIERRQRMFTLALIGWPLVMLTRPTFFPVAVLMPILLFIPVWRHRAYKQSALLIVSLVVVPLFFTIQNHMKHDIRSPSLHTPEMLYRCVVALIHTFQDVEEKGAHFAERYNYYRNVVPFENPAWVDLFELNRPATNFTASYNTLLRESKAYISEHPEYVVQLVQHEAYRHAFGYPLEYFPGTMPANELTTLQTVLRLTKRVGLMMGLFGLLLAVRLGRVELVLFLLGVCALVLSAALLVWWTGDRFRLPVDLLLIPAIALALCAPIPWLILAAFAALAYIPFKLLPLPVWYYPTASGVILVLGLLAIWTITTPFREWPLTRRLARLVPGRMSASLS